MWDKYGEKTITVAKAINNVSQKKKSAKSKDDDMSDEIVKDGLINLASSLDLEETTSEALSVLSQDEESDMLNPTTINDNVEIELERGSFEDGMNRLSGAINNAAELGFSNPEAVCDALVTLTEVANDTIRYVAEQETKQVEIVAKRDVAIAQINATSTLIKEYLAKTFDERSEIFAKQFECVDEALKTGNTEMLAMTLNSINSLAASSPFKNLADIGQVHQALNAGDIEWDI